MRRRAPTRAFREPTIALINVVFLMLVFFMVAGTLSRPLDRDLRLVDTAGLDGTAPPDTLVIHADGRLAFRGETLPDAASFLSALPDEARDVIRIVPDRALPAADLVRLTRELRDAGAGRVVAVTERGLP
ncbi:biopolymer transporter ExbD [Rhodobacterales bacterium HKCCE3408]|nr:biopolymer transporter ExbD [Rhodobacterales bacterium HKCCE3408]